MTDKAAREAFEKLYADELVASGHTCGRSFAKFDDGNYVTHMVQVRWIKFAQGYQAAHDAAMAAEPDAKAMCERLADYEKLAWSGSDENCFKCARETIESLLLRLQAKGET